MSRISLASGVLKFRRVVSQHKTFFIHLARDLIGLPFHSGKFLSIISFEFSSFQVSVILFQTPLQVMTFLIYLLILILPLNFS